MTELTTQSTLQPFNPPVQRPYAGWETACVFRETFLAWITPPGAADAFRSAGNLLFDLILNVEDWPSPSESPIRRELRAVGQDLRFAQGWLATALEANEAELHPDDARLVRLAGQLAPHVGRIAGAIERALGEEQRQ